MLTTIRQSAFLAFLLTTYVAVTGAGETDAPHVFDLPRLQAVHSSRLAQVLAMMQAGKFAAAETQLREFIVRVPNDSNAHYNLACALCRQGKNAEALTSLKKAVELGFRNREHIEADEDLEGLRGEDRYRSILKSVGELPEAIPSVEKHKVEPAQAAAGEVLITESNVVWKPKQGIFSAQVKFPEGASDDANLAVAVGLGKSGDLLRKWYEEGTAAGNLGDLYDNHDSDHSNMNFRALPQLTRVEFSGAAKKRHLHHGLQRFFLYNTVTIGNSSTAITSGPFWRSQGRLAITRPGGATLLYQQYRANHLYFYPEHRDHDPESGGKGHGDLFPANTPYLILSQGSSGSDRAFMNAVAQTLAAFPPDVKEELARAGMLMPAVQMIFRRSNKLVKSSDDYLTGKAHPTVFDGKQVDVVKMVTMAHDMTPQSLPPLVQLEVMEEDESTLGRDYFDFAQRERLFDTPCAIARIVKSTKYERRMVISAKASRDLREKPLAFRWVVLRGEAGRIRIRPLDESGTMVELIVPYHSRQPVAIGATLESNRVDIGVFAHNGDVYSAPALISFYYPHGEKRVYDEKNRIQVVDYAAPNVRKDYIDPFLDLRKDWRDEYRYGDEGSLLGWTRFRGEKQQEFTPEGRLVLKKDDRGHPKETVAVRYVAKTLPDRSRVLNQEQVSESKARKEK